MNRVGLVVLGLIVSIQGAIADPPPTAGRQVVTESGLGIAPNTKIFNYNGFIAFVGGPGDSMALYKYADGTAEFVAALTFRIQSMPEPSHPSLVARLKKADGTIVEEIYLGTLAQDCVNRSDVRRGFMTHPELFQDVDLGNIEFYYNGKGSMC